MPRVVERKGLQVRAVGVGLSQLSRVEHDPGIRVVEVRMP